MEYNYQILQIPAKTRQYRNMLKRPNPTGRISLAWYEKVYEGTIDAQDAESVLEILWVRLNVEQPEDYKARSLSVGDIVAVGKRMFICYSVGWQEFRENPRTHRCKRVVKRLPRKMKKNQKLQRV